MPDHTMCPRCRKIGFVRTEHVIRAAAAERHLDCGVCHYAWVVAEGVSPLAHDDVRTAPRTYSAAEVWAEAGVARDTLRSWRARGFVRLDAPAGRSGQRYSEADKQRVLRIAALVRAGYKLPSLGRLTDDELFTLWERTCNGVDR